MIFLLIALGVIGGILWLAISGDDAYLWLRGEGGREAFRPANTVFLIILASWIPLAVGVWGALWLARRPPRYRHDSVSMNVRDRRQKRWADVVDRLFLPWTAISRANALRKARRDSRR